MKNPFSWTFDRVKLLNELIWHTPLAEISKGKTFLVKHIRTLVLAIRGFTNDKVMLRASALTFYSLMAIVPVVAIAFAIAKGFGLDQLLSQLIIDEFQNQQEVLNWLLTNANHALEQTKGGVIAGIGIIILFWSVMSLLKDIELSFNHIWHIQTSRPFFRAFTDYLTIVIIAPIFIILSSSMTVFISTKLNDYMDSARILDYFKPVISFLFKFAPYILTWIVLTILLIVMPNTKVKFKPALISGIIAGTFLQLLQWLYIDVQYGIAKLNAIYGSFAAVPLFIIWVQSSWTIVLLGAELSYAYQNVTRHEMESEAMSIGHYEKKILVLLILKRIIYNFSLGKKPVNAAEIALNLKIPVRLVTDILHDLSSVNLVTVILEDDERLFQPAIDINKITVKYVFFKLEKHDIRQIVVTDNPDYDQTLAIMEEFDRLITNSNKNILLKDL